MKLTPIALALLLAGCSASASPSSTPTPTPSAIITSASPTPTPSPTATALAIGAKAKLAAGAITVQVVTVKPGHVSDRDAPTVVAMIRMCNVSNLDPIGPGWDPWSIVDGDGGQFEASTETYTGDPTPAYPFMAGDRMLQQGDCAKGWVVFEVKKGMRAATIEYDNEAGDHLEWKV